MLNQLRQLSSLDKEIDKWQEDGKFVELKHSEKEVQRLEMEKLSLEQKKKEIQQKTSKLLLALSNCENEERNLRNNLKLILNTTERELIDKQLKELQLAFENFKVQYLVKEVTELEAKIEASKIRVNLIFYSLLFPPKQILLINFSWER